MNCLRCNGTGRLPGIGSLQHPVPCSYCNGTGLKPKYPRIKLGVDNRLLGVVLAILLVGGCIAQPGGSKVTKPKPGAKQTLEQIAFESFQNRDIVRAKKLRALKGTKFDAKRMAAIETAGAESARETWEPSAKALANILDKLPQDDQAAFDNVLEQLAKASERAGK